jgi:hypothetical protein
MLQNRVDPFGQLIKTTARGTWIGNRGVIHNEQQQIVRPFRVKPWITCALEFKGRHREIMQPNRWTELFFLDEATAFSAGHRPCFQCRYQAHQKFKKFWIKGNSHFSFDMKTPISEIDAIIHAERIAKNKSKISYMQDLKDLPNGTFITYNEEPHLFKDKKLFLWRPEGYGNGIDLPNVETVQVLTPRSIVNMFSTGYIVQIGI